MPNIVFGNSSNNSDSKIDTSFFVQKPYLRTNSIEANKEEDIVLKSQNRIKNLHDPSIIREPASKKYVDNLFNDPSIIKNNAHIDLKNRNITNARFIQVNQWPQIDSQLTPKLYVDIAVDDSSLVSNNKDNDFGNYNLTNINSITLNTQAVNDNQVITKAYVDQYHRENERSRRDLGLDFYVESNDLVKSNQDNDLNDKKLTNLDSLTVNRNPCSDNEVSNKRHVDDSIGENTLLRFNQRIMNFSKSVGNDTYNLTKFDKIQIIDTAEIKYPNIGSDLKQKWNIKCNNKINQTRITDFIKSTKITSPTGHSGATSLLPIGNSFKYIEISSNNHGDERVFVSWKRTDIIQISIITFYYNRFSILINDSKKSMGRFRIQLLLEDNTWSTRYNIPKNDRYSNLTTQWTLVNLYFTVESYEIRLIYDQIDTPHADMCFSNITITQSVYYCF